MGFLSGHTGNIPGRFSPCRLCIGQGKSTNVIQDSALFCFTSALTFICSKGLLCVSTLSGLHLFDASSNFHQHHVSSNMCPDFKYFWEKHYFMIRTSIPVIPVIYMCAAFKIVEKKRYVKLYIFLKSIVVMVKLIMNHRHKNTTQFHLIGHQSRICEIKSGMGVRRVSMEKQA